VAARDAPDGGENLPSRKLGSRRLRRLAIAAGALVAVAVLVRAFLPWAVRSQLESRTGEAVAGRLEVGDVDLWVARGAIALHDVRFQADGAPSNDPPTLSLRRLYLDVSWLELWHRTLRVEDLELDDPEVRADRLSDGAIFVPLAREPASPPPAPETPPPAAEPPPPAPGPPWNVAVDTAVLRGGRLRLVDHLSDPPETAELALDGVRADGFRLIADATGKPGRATVEARFGDGVLRVETGIESRGAGFAIAGTIAAEHVPLDRLNLHVPQLGWSSLTGRLDAHIDARVEPGAQPALSGDVALHDFETRVPGLDAPALAWRKLDVAIAGVDLQRRDATVRRLALDGARVFVRPRAPAPLPVLAFVSAPAPRPAADAAPVEAPEARSVPAGAPSTAWTWKLEEVALSDASVTVDLPPAPMELAVTSAEVRGVASTGGDVTAKLDAAVEGGRVQLSGTFRREPLAGTAEIHATGLPLAALAVRAGELPVHVAGGTLAGDLKVALLDPAAGGDAHMTGTLSISDLALARVPDDKDFSAAWKSLELGVRDLTVPAVWMRPARDGEARPPIRLDLDRFRLVAPSVRLTRADEGLLLPGAVAPAAQPPSANPAATPAPPTPPSPAAGTAPGSAQGGPVAVHVAELELSRGDLTVVDRTVKPFVRTNLAAMELRGRDLRWPEQTFATFSFASRVAGAAPVDVRAKRSGDAIEVDVDARSLALPQFNPYLASLGTYTITSGAASLRSHVRWARGRYESSNDVALDDLELAGAEGDTIFADRFGVPLTLALSLLRDLSGRIALTVPVAGGRTAGAQIDLTSVIGQALGKAILGAITSPLKLLGAVLVSDGKVSGFTPEPIPFEAGRAEIAADGWWRVEQTANGLAAVPALHLTMRGSAGAADRRALQEAALLAELREEKGFLDTLRGLPKRGQDAAIRDWLAARAAGRPAPDLDEGDRAALEERLAARPVGDGELAALASARAERLRALLADQYGVGGDRIAVAPPQDLSDASPPAVVVGVGGLR